MKMWFLGTGAGRPNKHRNVTAIALQLPEPETGWWLFDCGEATQHQLMHVPLKLSKLEKIFITHLHGDHLYGLPGLLSSRSFDGGVTPLTMFGPAGLKSYIETVFSLTATVLDYELIIHELDEQQASIYKDERFRVEAGPLVHRVPCLGYRVEERDKRGPLMADKLRSLGVKSGPLFGQLKSGHSITLEDGTLITPEAVTDGVLRGRIVTVLGDTSPCEMAETLSRNADLIVHEATFAAGLEEKAHEFGHCTTVEAAQTAVRAGAKKVAMTHFSGRYSNEELSKLVEEAAAVFPQVIAATDLSMVEIPRVHER
ncbi:ribonuclease Z [Paenibacillus sp. 1011MAR3C5]|uniref:ribonuclease Z n=1 Tax=Paenibacillus sp. 1011MAR3C5 TaxID=1675787 RepID=UPI000E6B6221|nr:ribonuclease Z [Paenibacillus sp. 1011MAR3C5]RJE90175.1 ribonuclease Z [Paenibacillus sp. 1011MAR3C5]